MNNDSIWFERVFKFDLPLELFPMTVERLRGTPARLEDKVSQTMPEIMKLRDGESWSIQEQIGHLVMTEELWAVRTEEFLKGAVRLYAADLKNKKTHKSNFNEMEFEYLLKEFWVARHRLVERLEILTIEDAAKSALHPRLNQPMRIIDHAYFIAEHDDHHLSKMTDLIHKFG
jgi:hypothetical protein